jgi:hypothetical protein
MGIQRVEEVSGRKQRGRSWPGRMPASRRVCPLPTNRMAPQMVDSPHLETYRIASRGVYCSSGRASVCVHGVFVRQDDS